MTPELILDCRAIIGESLLWVPEENRLYWVDIKAPSLHALHLGAGTTRRWHLPADIGGFALDGAGKALVALRTGLYWLTLETNALDLLQPAPFDPHLIRFNESAIDSTGRFWIGTMTDPPPGTDTKRTGALYSFTTQQGLLAYPDFAYITNGMAWNEDESTFFLSHSEERTIYKYEYDRAGKLGRRTPYVKLTSDGIPDGAAVDQDGHYWCAIHGAGCLHRYTPEGTLAQSIHLPVSQPTMCCFAGKDLDELYVSSARDGLDKAALTRESVAGGLFRIKAECPGLKRHWRVA